MKQDINQLLLEDIQPYLGCTDVAVMSLGMALAAHAVQGVVPVWLDAEAPQHTTREIQADEVVSITLKMNDGLYKNCHKGAIPGTGGFKGIQHAAALGLSLDPNNKLNLFARVREPHITCMKKIASAGKITIETVRRPACNLYLNCKLTVITGKKETITSEVLIKDHYTRVMSLSVNEKILYKNPEQSLQLQDRRTPFDIPALIRKVQQLSLEVYDKLEETIKLNQAAYQYGLQTAPGLGIGKRMQQMMKKELIGNDAVNHAAYKTAAAEDVRMAGENIAVMGITGSGSHGIAASIPIIAVAEKFPKPRKTLLQSIALSFRLTQMMDNLNGHLTAPCGCVIKAGIGAAAAVAFYMGGSASKIAQAINNFIISSAGVICDGAKPTCSIKLANSAGNACNSAFLAMEGVVLTQNSGGIVRNDLEKNINNMVQISKHMESIDPVIVDILKGYESSPRSVPLISRTG